MTNPAPRAVVSEAEIEELRKLAEAACPGPWRAAKGYNRHQNVVELPNDEGVLCWFSVDPDPTNDARWEASAQLIAALNPATVLRILADREAAEARLREAEELLKGAPVPRINAGWGDRRDAFLSKASGTEPITDPIEASCKYCGDGPCNRGVRTRHGSKVRWTFPLGGLCLDRALAEDTDTSKAKETA